jgi:hypothetical protein
VAQVVALICWASGAVLESVIGPWSMSELRLWRDLWPALSPGEIVLADRLYCSFYDMVGVLRRRCDAVFRLHHRRPEDFRQGKRLGKNDPLVTWQRLRRTVRPVDRRPRLASFRRITLRCHGPTSAEDREAGRPKATIGFVSQNRFSARPVGSFRRVVSLPGRLGSFRRIPTGPIPPQAGPGRPLHGPRHGRGSDRMRFLRAPARPAPAVLGGTAGARRTPTGQGLPRETTDYAEPGKVFQEKTEFP